MFTTRKGNEHSMHPFTDSRSKLMNSMALVLQYRKQSMARLSHLSKVRHLTGIIAKIDSNPRGFIRNNEQNLKVISHLSFHQLRHKRSRCEALGPQGSLRSVEKPRSHQSWRTGLVLRRTSSAVTQPISTWKAGRGGV